MLMLPFDAQGRAPATLTDPFPRPSVDYDRALRLADFVVAAVLLVVLAPLFLLIALLIVASDGKSPLFAQCRLGQHGRVFACWKFRTMVPDADQRLAGLLATTSLDWRLRHKLAADPRVTWFGRSPPLQSRRTAPTRQCPDR